MTPTETRLSSYEHQQHDRIRALAVLNGSAGVSAEYLARMMGLSIIQVRVYIHGFNRTYGKEHNKRLVNQEGRYFLMSLDDAEIERGATWGWDFEPTPADAPSVAA